MRNRWLGFISLTLLGELALGMSLGAATLREELSETFQLTPGSEITLSNTNGSVTVTSWDRNDVLVEATKSVKANDNDRAAKLMKDVRVEISQDRGRLEITTRLPSTSSGLMSWIFGQGYSASVAYRLTVPREVDLELHTVNGSVTVQAVRGELDARTTNGAIAIVAARGSVQASTVNGGIQVDFEDVEPDGDMTFRTTNGSISVTAPDGLRADLDARTINGRVTSDFAEGSLSTDRRRRRLAGEINGGGGRLSLRTINGSIRLASQ